MMIWAVIAIYSNSIIHKDFGYTGENRHKKACLSLGSRIQKASTPTNRVWWHTRAQIFSDVVSTGAGAIIPVGTTISVHGVRPSPFCIVAIHCSRYFSVCQGKADFVYNSFTDGQKSSPNSAPPPAKQQAESDCRQNCALSGIVGRKPIKNLF